MLSQHISTGRRVSACSATLSAALCAFGVSGAPTAAAEGNWSLSVCGATNDTGSLVGSWSGIGQTAQASVDDMKNTAPDGLTASGPCFAFDNLSETQARQGQDKVRGDLSAKPPAAVWTALTGKQAPAELQR